MKKRTLTAKLDLLHPNTIAALVGQITLAPDLQSGTVVTFDHGAVYQAKNVCGPLVVLVESIRHCKDVEALKPSYQEALAKLERVAGIAVAVDDAAFPAQLGFAMECARDPALPRRRAIHRAWRHLTSGFTSHNHLTGETRTFLNPTKDEFKALAESFFGHEIERKTFDHDIKAMDLDGFQTRFPGRPRIGT